MGFALLKEREEKKRRAKQEVTEAGGRLQYSRSCGRQIAIQRWGCLDFQCPELGYASTATPLSREQWERLLWQCRDQESSGRLGLSIPAPLHPVDVGGGCRQRLKEKASLARRSGQWEGCGGFRVQWREPKGEPQPLCWETRGEWRGEGARLLPFGPRGEPRIKVEQAGRACVWEQNQEHRKWWACWGSAVTAVFVCASGHN